MLLPERIAIHCAQHPDTTAILHVEGDAAVSSGTSTCNHEQYFIAPLEY